MNVCFDVTPHSSVSDLELAITICERRIAQINFWIDRKQHGAISIESIESAMGESVEMIDVKDLLKELE